MSLEQKKIMLAAGGTGGHIFPAVALGLELQSQGADVSFVTDIRGGRFLPKKLPFKLMIFAIYGLGSSAPIKKLFGLINLVWVFFRVLQKTWRLNPDLIIGFGGYAAFPCVAVAKLLSIPLWIHEQNAYMGRTNRWFSPMSEKILLSFKETKGIPEDCQEKSVYVGLPVRTEIEEAAKHPYEYTGQFINVLVIGGSQGARIFAERLPNALVTFPPELLERVRVIHQCRASDAKRLKELYDGLGIVAEVTPFIKNIGEVLGVAHLVISRSGASSTKELAVAKRPVLFVPYPHAMDNHQVFNAKWIVDLQGGWCIEEKDFTVKKLMFLLQFFLDRPSLLLNAQANLEKYMHTEHSATKYFLKELNTFFANSSS